METPSIRDHIHASLDGLKDFQQASVQTIYKNLYTNEQPCMLLADEVGLGKTVVARGLISKLIKERMEAGITSPLKVTYICSNQVIAKENLRKLNPLPKSLGLNEPIDRIAYLAWEPKRRKKAQQQNFLELNTLTPATSFQVSQSAGNIWERRILYVILSYDSEFRNELERLRLLLKGTVTRKDYDQMMEYRRSDRSTRTLRQGIVEDLTKRLKKSSQSEQISGIPESFNLYEATLTYVRSLTPDNAAKRSYDSYLLTKQLRKVLIDCCLQYVDADVFILDEFQRFRDLIETNSQQEQAIIANRIFFEENTNSKVLLLSATPFKAFTGHNDLDRGEDHYKDFNRVLAFLLRGDKDTLTRYDTERRRLYEQLIAIGNGKVERIDASSKEAVESILRKVMCRTERNSVASHSNSMVIDTWKNDSYQLPFSGGDIENYKQTDRVAKALETVTQMRGNPIEYCKSALFPLSFLDRYKLKDDLKKHKDQKHVKGTLARSKNAWIDFTKVEAYQPLFAAKGAPAANARLLQLVAQAVGESGEKLLWIPPSLPYYPLEDAYEGTEGFSKTLLFSSWVMVPRMASTLVSYEVERRTIGDPQTVDDQEKEERNYFTAEGKKRHPVPQLVFRKRDAKDGSRQLASMSLFTLIYPSLSLAEIIDPIQNLADQKSLDTLRTEVSERIRSMLKDCQAEQYITQEGESERWYWAAPLLLDRINHLADIRSCIAKLENGSTKDSDSNEEEDGVSIQREHYDYILECLESPHDIGLGTMPDNLPDVLADVALGSPAVIALRSLKRLFPDRENSSQLKRALKVGQEFRALLNKPESIAAIRLSERDRSRHRWYWQMVLDYCASGCLQSVVDEYFHLLKGQNVDGAGAVEQLISAINLNASTINVDSLESFQSGTPRKMRCHYAVEFGSQRIETEGGQQRASGIREVFNSPFRPYLLSTTSIGQEGLDFHSYCRRIVHWNLPSNPVDLEQREGRINRFKSLSIRQLLALKYSNHSELTTQQGDIWEHIFKLADAYEREAHGKCELVPSWHVDSAEDRKIERIVPLYPYSMDQVRLRNLLQTLALYRLAFGQPRQSELIDHLIKREMTEEEIQTIMKTLMVSLSPISS